MNLSFYITILINAICFASANDLFTKGKQLSGYSDQEDVKPTHRIFVLTGTKLGQGAFGVAYEATSAADESKWALKFALDQCSTFELLESAKKGNELYGNPVYYNFDDEQPELSFVATPFVSGVPLQHTILSNIQDKSTFEDFLQTYIFSRTGVLNAIIRKLHNRNLVHNDLWVHGNNIFMFYNCRTDRMVVNFIDFDMLATSTSKGQKTFELILFMNMIATQWNRLSKAIGGKSIGKSFDWKQYSVVSFEAVRAGKIVFNQGKLEAFREHIFESDSFQKILKREENIAVLRLQNLDPKSKWTFTFDACSQTAEIVEEKMKSEKSRKMHSFLSVCKTLLLPHNWDSV